MFQKKNILIGIIGIALTVLTTVLSLHSGILTSEQEVTIVLSALAIGFFFFGYLFGGFSTGLSFGGAIGAIILLNAAPDSWKGPLALVLLASIFLGPRLKAFILNRKSKALDDVTEDVAEYEAERQLEDIAQSLFANAVYLIKPNKFKGDVTYKAVNRGDNILFFRVGGQFYDINPEIAMNEHLDISDIESLKGSFALDKSDIQNVIIKTKRRKWTGNIQNNGTVYIATANGTADYIIHDINDYPLAQAFFEEALARPVEMVLDKKRAQEEQRESAFEQKEEPEKAWIRKTSNALNTAGYLVGLWLIFLPRPIHLAVAIGIILPIVGMIFYIRNSRFVTLNEHQNQKLPGITAAIIMPALGLALLTLIGFNIIYSWQMWLVIALISLIISIPVIIKSKEFKLQKWLVFFVPVIIFVYIYGVATVSNCLYDYHGPQFKNARVVDKDFSESSKYDEYSVVLESWRQKNKTVKATVTKNQYLSFEVGDELIVATFDGLWQIEWYRIYGKAESGGNKFGKSGLLGTLNG